MTTDVKARVVEMYEKLGGRTNAEAPQAKAAD